MLVPGFLGHDAFNLVVGVPIVFAVVCLAQRGNPIALLVWPGALLYVLYTFAIYLIGAPFSGLFLAYVVLVALSGFTTIALMATSQPVPLRGQSSVHARALGGLLIALAVLTIAQDVSGVISTAVRGGLDTDPLARPVWTVDLSIEAPALLIGGLLLWSKHPLGFLASLGLLLQYGLTPAALAFTAILQAGVTGAPLDWASVAGVLMFALVCFVPLVLVVRPSTKSSARRDSRPLSRPPLGPSPAARHP